MKRLLSLLALCAALLLTGCAEKTCSAHVDANADDICDECGDSVVIAIDFYGINDLHGKIMDATTHPGVDELTTYLQNAKDTEDNVVLLSVGDMWQGSAESNQTKGQLMTQWMNELGFVSMTLGNHEFDWGESYIQANDTLATFPFLAINIYDTETKAQVDYCESSVMVECDGVQVGIIGAIGDCYSSIAPDHVKGVYFKTGAELTQLVMDESDRLRAEGADFIVYVLHDGLGDSYFSGPQQVSDQQLSSFYDSRLSDGYVDLVFEGHTHQSYILEDSQGVYHLQNGGDNNGITHVQVQLHALKGTADVVETELILTSEYEDLEDAEMVADLLEEYDELLAPVMEVIGTISHACPGDTLRQQVADLYYMAGIERWGAEYDIVLGGGFISIRDPGYLPKGDVTYGQLQGLFPFDNELVLCTIRGKDLQERFLETDDDRYFICCGLYGEEVKENLDPNATYYIVVDSYTSTYKPNNLTEVERYGADTFARDLLAEYIRNGGIQ